MSIAEQLAELRDWLQAASGKLAAAASLVGGALAYVSTDPSAALFVSQILPPPLNYLMIAAVVVIAYVLPHWAQKKDQAGDDQA
jgi:hypothetical protein